MLVKYLNMLALLRMMKTSVGCMYLLIILSNISFLIIFNNNPKTRPNLELSVNLSGKFSMKISSPKILIKAACNKYPLNFSILLICT